MRKVISDQQSAVSPEEEEREENAFGWFVLTAEG